MICSPVNQSVASIMSLVSETSSRSIITRRYLKNVNDNSKMILNIKIRLICKGNSNCNYHQYSVASQVARFMFSNKRAIPLAGSGLMPSNNVKEVFIEPRDRWHYAIVCRTKQKALHNNPENHKNKSTFFSSQESPESQRQKIPSRIQGCFAYSSVSISSNSQMATAAFLTSILKGKCVM